MRLLRGTALGVAVVGGAAALWFALGAPGPFGSDDPYYRLAHVRNLFPFIAVAAAISALVFVASGQPRSSGRGPGVGLWLVLAGSALVLAEPLIRVFFSPVPRRVVAYGSGLIWFEHAMLLLLAAGAMSLIAGALLWLFSGRIGGSSGPN